MTKHIANMVSVGTDPSFPAESMTLPASMLIEEAIAAAPEPKLVRQRLKQIAFSWPNLPNVVERFALVVGHRFPDFSAGTSLLSNSLSKATEAFASAGSMKGKGSDFAAANAFLSALLDASRGIASADVFGLTGEHSVRWDLGRSDLVEFCRGYEAIQFAEITPREREVTGTRMVLLGRILTVEDAAMLEVCPRSSDCLPAGPRGAPQQPIHP